MKTNLLAQLTLVLLLAPVVAQAQLASQKWGKHAGDHRIHLKADQLEGLPLGPFAILPDGKLITVEDSTHATNALISLDDGKSWQKIPIFTEPDRFNIRHERALICPPSGLRTTYVGNRASGAS